MVSESDPRSYKATKAFAKKLSPENILMLDRCDSPPNKQQLEERLTGIAEVMGSNPVEAS